MRRAWGLVLAFAALATLAQERPMPSLPGFPGGMMIDPRQLQRAPMRVPTKEEAKELERQSAEMSRLNSEIQRLQRLGRLEEAEALGRQLDELMSSGPMGEMLQQQRSATRDMLRQMGPALGIDLPEEALQDASEISVGGLLAMGRRASENEESFLPEPLFVRPVPLLMVSDHGKQMMRVPKPARDLMNEAYLRAAAKDWSGAEQALSKAFALGRSPLLVEARGRIAMMRRDYPAALRQFQSALEAVEAAAGPRSALGAQLLWEQAAMHAELGAPRRAVEASERALAMLEPGSFDHAAGLNNLGVALQQSGDAGAALKAYQSSLASLRQPAPPGPGSAGLTGTLRESSVAQVAANLGLAQWQRGDPAAALATFRTALDDRAAFENNADPFMTERGALAKSQALAVELHSMMTLERIVEGAPAAPRTTAGGPVGLQMLLERKGAVLERQSRALTGFRRDAQGAEQGPSGVFGGLFESPLDRRLREQANEARAGNQELLREYEAAAAERAALGGRAPGDATERAAQRKKMAELDTRMQLMQREMQMHEAGKKDAAADARVDRRELATIARESSNDPQKMMAEMKGAGARREQARQQSLREARGSLFARVQERLPEEAVLLEMVKYRPLDPRAGLAEDKRWGPARYGTYVIRSKGAPAYVDLGEAEPLDKLVQAFRHALANPEGATGRELGRKLDEALMRPVRAHMGNARLIYVAPEGSLNLAPLAALVDEQGRYLLERFTFTYLASGRDLLVLQRGDPPRGPPVIFADPAFSLAGASTQSETPQKRSRDFRNAKFESLPGTALEAQTLKRILPDAVVLTGKDATETAAKGIGGPRILHIATHGFFLEDAASDAEDPMLRSGLVFAGVNALGSAQDDGVLTALEAAGLDLRGTRLVVLSACETGLGEVKNGEGVFGLRRAFVVAGAETLLMSLWQVADEATKDLMVAYYTRLARGEPRAEALRQAQLGMLAEPKTSRPFFWAAFISSGEAGSLK